MDGELKTGTILVSESGTKYTVKSLLGAGGQGVPLLGKRSLWKQSLQKEARINPSCGPLSWWIHRKVMFSAT